MARDTPKVWKRTPKRLQTAISGHAAEKAREIRARYGPTIDQAVLARVLGDRKSIRYPVRIEFGSKDIEAGLFAVTKPISEDPEEGYVITLHEHFRNQPQAIAALALYQSVIVNYGDLASAADGEIFGAGVLGMERDDYYTWICELTDSIAESGEADSCREIHSGLNTAAQDPP